MSARSIKSVDMTKLQILSGRNVNLSSNLRSLRVDQSIGRIIATESAANGRVIIYPQLYSRGEADAVILDVFVGTQRLHYPQDATMDFIRNRVWIADGGNNRVLKVNPNTKNVTVEFDDILYPYSLAVESNLGGCFVLGYADDYRRVGVLEYISSNGFSVERFEFNEEVNLSSSSSSSSSDEGLLSSSSSSGDAGFVALPSPYKVAYDASRWRCWWISGLKIYMIDLANSQIQVQNFSALGYNSIKSIEIETRTGNAFVVASDLHNDFIVELFRNNTRTLGAGYVI